MKRLLLALPVLFLLCAGARANDVYVAQVAAGGANGLISCANAVAVTYFNTSGNWSATPTGIQIGPGTTVHLCGTFTSNITFQGDGATGNPFIVHFEPGANFTTAAFSGSYISVAGHSFWIIDGGTNGLMQNTANGTLLANQVSSTAINMFQNCGHDIEIKNLTIQNMYVRQPSSSDVSVGTNSEGILGIGCSNNVHIHHSTINNVHAGVQLACGASTCTNWEVDHNTISNFTWGVRTTTGNNTSVALNHVYVHDNDIKMNPTWCCVFAQFHLDGLFADASGSVDGAGSIDFLFQYNNYIHGDGGSPSPTAWIYDNQNNHHTYIFNNVLTQEAPGAGAADGYITYGINASDTNIVNNTVVGFGFTNPTGAAFTDFATVTPPTVIQNNVVFNTSTAASIHNSGTPAPLDYNAYFQICSTTPLTFCPGATGWDTLGFNAWKAGGQDTHGVYGNVALSPNAPYMLQSGSVAIGMANNLYGTFGCASPVIPGLGAWCKGAPQTFGVTGSCGTGCITRPNGAQDAGAYPFNSGISIPAVPTGFTATASGSTINLSWTASTGTPAGYNVLRSTVTGGPYSPVANVTSGTSFANTGLANGTYFYVVNAYNSAGTSANSTQASATVSTAPAATLAPASLSFGPVITGTTSGALVDTVTSTGTANLVLAASSAVTISGPNAADFAISGATTCTNGLSMTPTNKCTISVTFTPSTTGPETASLVVVSNDPFSPDTVSLFGTGQGAVVISPVSISFGNVFINKTSSTKTATYTNNSGSSITFTSVAITTGDSTQFSLGTNTCTGTLTNGNSCTSNVTCTPNNPGNKSTTLVFTDNSAGSPRSVALTCTAKSRHIAKNL